MNKISKRLHDDLYEKYRIALRYSMKYLTSEQKKEMDKEMMDLFKSS